MAVNVARWADFDLPQRGIHISPATLAELKDREAATDASGNGEIEILLRYDFYDQLFMGNKRSNRARATVVHELSHVILHVQELRERKRYPDRPDLLNRLSRADIPAFEDPEWQAWALAGCIMMPFHHVKEIMQPGNIDRVASVFGVSQSFARKHIETLRRNRFL